MTLKLLGTGFGRTGTSSTKTALEILGWGPCHHMDEIRHKPNLLSDWKSAAEGVQMDWKRVFNGYTSQIDWPGARYWRQLIDVFSDAKVIHTWRDPEEWYDSLKKTIIPSTAIGMKVDEDLHARAMAEMVYQTVHRQIFLDRIMDRTFAIKIYLDHLNAVKSAIPADRLLIFDVKKGWQPLCDFLQLAKPNEPFPHENTKDEFIHKRSFLSALNLSS